MMTWSRYTKDVDYYAASSSSLSALYTYLHTGCAYTDKGAGVTDW
jgi:hypothetical protein